MEKAKDFYSKSVADAIRQACAEFATSQEKLDIEVVETGSAGIFGLCRKRAHIRVTRKQKAGPEKKAGGRKPAPIPAGLPEEKKVEPIVAAAETEPAGGQRAPKGSQKGRGRQKQKKTAESPGPEVETEPVAPPTEEMLASVKSDLDQVLRLMGFPSEIGVTVEEASIQCQINGEYEEDIIGPEGRVLDSLQYLLRKMSSREMSDRIMIDLNAGDFRERRIEELKKTALELAEKVKADGKTQAIPALNPSERRVVHVALQDDTQIRSRSVGEGLFKKVLIYKPGSKGKKSGGRRRGRQGGGSADE